MTIRSRRTPPGRLLAALDPHPEPDTLAVLAKPADDPSEREAAELFGALRRREAAGTPAQHSESDEVPTEPDPRGPYVPREGTGQARLHPDRDARETVRDLFDTAD